MSGKIDENKQEKEYSLEYLSERGLLKGSGPHYSKVQKECSSECPISSKQVYRIKLLVSKDDPENKKYDKFEGYREIIERAISELEKLSIKDYSTLKEVSDAINKKGKGKNFAKTHSFFGVDRHAECALHEIIDDERNLIDLPNIQSLPVYLSLPFNWQMKEDEGNIKIGEVYKTNKID